MKTSIIAVIIAAALIGAVMLLAGSSGSTGTPEVANNVSIVNGTQIISVSVKGGYHPQQSTAKAGMPTVLRFQTNGTFDCSSSIRIPSLSIARTLPPSGATDIDLGSPQAGILNGTCGMGMYSFEINFQG